MARTIYNVTILDIADYAVERNEVKSFENKTDAQKYFRELADQARIDAHSYGWYDDLEDDGLVDTDTSYEIGQPFEWGTSAIYIHLVETTLE